MKILKKFLELSCIAFEFSCSKFKNVEYLMSFYVYIMLNKNLQLFLLGIYKILTLKLNIILEQVVLEAWKIEQVDVHGY